MSNQITVLFFANLREMVGMKKTSIDIPDGTNVKGFKVLIGELYPSLIPQLATTLVSINKEYSFDEDLVPMGAEVALFPPVSGGTDGDATRPSFFGIEEGELDLNELVERITTPRTGAACVFTGMVRAVTQRDNPHETQYLEYQAYQKMAVEKMQQVGEEIWDSWPSVEGIAIVQRIGHLNAGTPTVVIACSAGHRDSGVFEAARYGIDRLKEIVPIWKKEVGPDGELWIEGEYFPKAGE
jgi:molybdopterin synthase catalytic subunit/molybdopterin converting factor small subunit